MAVGQKTGVCRYRWTAKQLYWLLAAPQPAVRVADLLP
jgi:hypothetical protein